MIYLTFITGPMFSGKTTALAKLLRAAQARGTRITLLRPAVDTRINRSIDFIRPVMQISRTTGTHARRAAAQLSTTPVIGIDEVQFLASWTVNFLSALEKETRLQDVQVCAAGLDLKADGTPWPSMAALAERANLHIRRTATCARCGAPATLTLSQSQLPKDGIQVGDDGYEPVCQACWEKAQAEKTRTGAVPA